MKILLEIKQSLLKLVISSVAFLLSLSVAHSAHALSLSQTPLFVGQNAKPTIMLAMSRDQELYYSAYPDYSNLNGGNLRDVDTTYRNDFEYAGYFDSKWCYSYTVSGTIKNSTFNPVSLAVDHKCSHDSAGVAKANSAKDRWSGNFLNWASMTRIDILRKVLYGGSRYVDTTTKTVLTRSFLPKESHAFVKVYKNAGTNTVASFTPYSNTAISLCNVSTESDPTNGYPVIRAAAGSWPQWSHTEIQECQWRGSPSLPTTKIGSNSSPSQSTDKLDELVARVSVCETLKDSTTNDYVDSDKDKELNRCKVYQADSYKPIGLLQKYYKTINFGLVTGTWANPTAGGVLRKKASQIAGNTYTGTDTVNEYNADTGVFNSANITTGIIKTIDAFQIKGFSSFTTTDGDKSYVNTSDWGNPIGEIYSEALRYLLGKTTPTLAFNGTDSWLTKESSPWTDPIPTGNWCSKCSIVIISSGPNSYDGGDGSLAEGGKFPDSANFTDTFLGTVGSLTHATLNSNYTDVIGKNEFKTGGTNANVFYGGLSVANQCKVASKKMSTMQGKCPEAPTNEGTYDVAGLAYWAHITDHRSYAGDQNIDTYAVELSEGLPNFQIPIDGKTISFVPVCSANSKTTACSLVGTRVESVVNDVSGNPISGSYLFYWEDQSKGSDYDMDAVQRISFCVGLVCPADANGKKPGLDEVRITNSIPYWATGTGTMHMSYILAGAGSSDGLQEAQYVYRTGYEYVSTFTSDTTMGNKSWYNTILPQGTDVLPGNTTVAKYFMQTAFKASGSNVIDVKTPLYYAAKWGSFDDAAATSNGNKIPDQDSEWDNLKLDGTKGIDRIPDNYFMMKNPSLLEGRLYSIFSKAGSGQSSGTGISTNSTELNTDTKIYQALFYTGDWFGELRALNKDFSPAWTTRDKLKSSIGRNIFSSANNAGIIFSSTNFTSTFTNTPAGGQQAALGGATEGPKVVNWVRGDTNIAGKRSRVTEKHGTQLMGDIVNSTPVYSGSASQGYDKLHVDYGAATYASYVSDIKEARKEVIYVGANDGMLHAIDASNGNELFAYVPTMIYSKLPILAAPTYGITVPHTYTVDGPITVGDAFINGSWRTILVGTLGAGGRGIFVLDVTDPEHFSASNVLFELTPSDTGYSDIGNVMGKPLIAPVAGRWKIIFGNGYNGASGNAGLYVIDIQYPKNTSYSKYIQAGTSIDNGLARPTALQDASTGAISYVYAGDLLGNMWKFDLSSTAVSGWKLALSGAPLFKAKDASNNPQPIFNSPTLGSNSNLPTSTMVYFGTGKYIEGDDVGATQMSRVQSFYGLADEGTSISYTSSRNEKLQEKTMTSPTTKTRNVNDSGTSATPVSWTTKKGWYLDFPAGERIISKPLLLYDRLLFSTVIPGTDLCSYGGSGWLMELVGVGDVYGTEKELLPDNGIWQEFFLPGDLVKLKGDDGTHIIESDIKGNTKDRKLNDPSEVVDGLGRVSWRQLK